MLGEWAVCKGKAVGQLAEAHHATHDVKCGDPHFAYYSNTVTAYPSSGFVVMSTDSANQLTTRAHPCA